jgi:beta-glucanase (GH16 family)
MRNLSAFILSLLIFSSCSKSGNSNNNNTPTNLTLMADVIADNSGNVSFAAAATNAVSYEFDFGNGIFQTVASGIVTYKYPVSGTYTVVVVAKGSGGQTISTSKSITIALSLLWSEEFNTAGAPDAAKWGYDIGTGSGGWGNNELEYYTNRSDNVTISGGTLKIIAKKENYSGSAYTSARMLTKDKFSFKYGKIEVRAKLPSGVGTWPAIWMLGSNLSTVSWPACGEIDIMEHKGSELNKIYSTLHYPGHSGGGGVGGTTTIAAATTQFHNYAAIWDASSIKFSVDDVVFFTAPNSNSLPFNQNFFVILNFAMGGSFAGAVDPSFVSATMEIDYVRVYQ